MKIYKTICPYDCPTSCGLLAESDGERIVNVKGDPADPISKGLICRKMQHYEKSDTFIRKDSYPFEAYRG